MVNEESKIVSDRMFVGRLVIKRQRVIYSQYFLPLVILVEIRIKHLMFKYAGAHIIL